jgi:hypothetical protein
MRFYASIRNLLFLALVMLAIPAASHAQIALSVAIAPPELPVYEQPVCPGDDYIWTPGYWYYADDDYVWVPGTWVLAPEVGFLWTPPWWGWEGGLYIFHVGFWGPHVGFYGGINYGFGYFGHGFEGGHWDHDHFFYNRSVTNVDVHIRNVYNTRVDENVRTRVSFNGGNGGINERANAEEEAAARDRHVGPVAAQEQHREAARSDPGQRYSANHGKPVVVSTSRAGEYKRGGLPGAKENGTARTTAPSHVKDLPSAERPAPVKTGNAKTDQKYQQQQERLNAKQDQERQKVQQKQEQDHQRLDQQKANDARRQQTEQRHQQQTQQLVQKHTQQQQQLQHRQQPAAKPSGGGKPK